MRIIREKVHLFIVTVIGCVSILFSTPNYSNPSYESERVTTAQALREYYLDYYYWMEALSRAPLMLVEHDYSGNDAPLSLDDLKRIYNLSFTASHLTDPVYFSLRNAYYTANFQDGKPFDMARLDKTIVQHHQRYLHKLHEMHRHMSPYYEGALQVGKTFSEVNQQVLIPAYEESYQAYKQWMVQYSPEEKPYDPELGQKRAEQWLRFEIASQLLTAMSPIIDKMKSQKAFETCLYPTLRNLTDKDRCLEAYAVHSVQSIAEQFLQHRLLERLMPDIHAALGTVASRSVYQLHTDPVILLKIQQRLQNVILWNKPPYGLAYFPVRFSRDRSLEETGMDLHKFAGLSLESLEVLKADIQTRRKTVSNRAVTPDIVIRELGIAVEPQKTVGQ